MKTYQISIVLLLIIETCLTLNDTHYRAAVIEYYPVVSPALTSEERTIAIVEEYVGLLLESQDFLDIVVFPESTITTGIRSREELVKLSPIISNGTIPCGNTTEETPDYFKDLSCAAKRFNTYLVANIVEKSLCTQEECATDNYNLYNTNVVFDRQGRIVGKYRKYHLYGEYEKNSTKTVDLITIATDFGVTFGTFTCFDVLFEEPTLWLTRNGTKHHIFPTMWFSEAPFLTALQVQNMFAVATNSILLASGANNPKIGSGGTGIYEGIRGALNMGIISEGGSKVFINDVPKEIKENIEKGGKPTKSIDEDGLKTDNVYLKQDNLQDYSSFPIDEDVDTTTYCHGAFCCKFTIKSSKTPPKSENYYRYRIFVYSGVRSFSGVYNGGIEICAVAFCKNNTIESCGERILPYNDIEWSTTFESIEISGVFDDSPHKIQYPNSLLSNLEPLGVESYQWKSSNFQEGEIERSIKLVAPQSRILTFGIYGRDFARDSAPQKILEVLNVI